MLPSRNKSKIAPCVLSLQTLQNWPEAGIVVSLIPPTIVTVK